MRLLASFAVNFQKYYLLNYIKKFNMALYQILYWQDIPSQVKVWDDFDELKFELSQKFIIKIDQAAKAQGLMSEDDYLAQWKWSDEEERPGDAEAVAGELKKELEGKFSR